MRVLLHDSHNDPARPCGWSGAPGECTWVLDLNARIVVACRLLGIEVVRVPGDLRDHPAFHTDYDAFVAPHYESDTHDDHVDADTGLPHRGGWFWGRAAASTTAPRDDALGAIFERRYRALLARFAGGPDEHPGWTTVNVTDFYGFRLTSETTPGVLAEHGVGDPADPSDDGAWLRAHVQDIADVWALTLAEFGGVPVTTAGDQMRPYYANARALYPMYAPEPFIEPDFQYNPPPSDTPDAITGAVDANHQLHIACRFDYPAAAGDPAWRALEMENTFDHEIGGHGFKAYLYHYEPNVDWNEVYWQARGFPGTYAAHAAANDPYVWASDPNESWGEAGGAALAGAWTKPEKTVNYGKPADPLAIRFLFKQWMYQARPQLKEVFMAKFISDDLAITLDANGNAVVVTRIPASAGFVSGQKAACDSKRIGVVGNEPTLPIIMPSIAEDAAGFYVRSVIRGDPVHSGTGYIKVSAWQ